MAFAPLSPAHSEQDVQSFQPISPAHSVESNHVFAPLSPARTEESVDAYQPLSPSGYKMNRIERLISDIQKSTKQSLSSTKKPTPYKSIGNWRFWGRHMIYNEKKMYNEVERDYNNAINFIVSNFVKSNINRKNLNLYRKAFSSWKGEQTTFQVMKYDKNSISKTHDIIRERKKKLNYQKNIFTRQQLRITYVRFMEIKREQRKEILKTFIKEWRDTCPTPIKPPLEPIKVSSDPFHVIAKLNVDETGRVRVSLKAPLEKIYKQYHSKFKKPPAGEYIDALEEFGYPSWKIEQMRVKLATNGEQLQPEGSIFSRMEKASKPKKKVKSTLAKFRSPRLSPLEQ